MGVSWYIGLGDFSPWWQQEKPWRSCSWPWYRMCYCCWLADQKAQRIQFEAAWSRTLEGLCLGAHTCEPGFTTSRKSQTAEYTESKRLWEVQSWVSMCIRVTVRRFRDHGIRGGRKNPREVSCEAAFSRHNRSIAWMNSRYLDCMHKIQPAKSQHVWSPAFPEELLAVDGYREKNWFTLGAQPQVGSLWPSRQPCLYIHLHTRSIKRAFLKGPWVCWDWDPRKVAVDTSIAQERKACCGRLGF